MINWNFPDEDGCTNSYVMRDDCTGYMDDLVVLAYRYRVVSVSRRPRAREVSR
jgi:hypothetical protein